MEIQVLILGTECLDRATQLIGTLTHWIMDMGGRVQYLFQPKGLNEEGQPLKKLFMSQERFEVTAADYETVEVPFEILGTLVTHKASGFAGMAVEFVRHINGCFHVVVQPRGTLPKKGTPIASCEFDLRELTGEMIQKLTAEQHKKSIEDKPSPSEVPERRSYGL